MGIKVWINGAIHDEEDAVVSVFDRGFLYGDSVYEVMRTAGGHTVDLDAHLARLQRSARGLMLGLPSAEILAAAVRDTLAAAGNPESYVRVIATRGAGEIGLDLDLAVDPHTIVVVKPLAGPAPEMYESGVKLQVVGIERTSRRAIDPALKSGNYLNSILALAEARRAGAYEAVMCDSVGRVAEGSTSNLFVVRAGAIATPASEVGLLPGITRQRIMELSAGDGIPTAEAELTPDDLRGADEVFITSSIRGVLPVSHVDGRSVGADCPGPVTRRVMELYAGYLARVARGDA
jgi:branched-chain amino acid aminotransferase